MLHEPSARPSVAGDRPHRWATSALILGVGLAWTAVVVGPDGMDVGVSVFVLTWTVMMVAMMVPSAAPLLMLYNRGASGTDTTKLTAGYLSVWAAAGVPAYVLHELLPMSLGPVALATAGLYQLTPIKTACLRHCRSPADFLVQHWGRGALWLGVEHGLWCLGCCWALMIVLVMVGSMGLAWVVGVAALVALEKLSVRGALWARVSGVALLIWAILLGVKLWTGASMDMS